jgi:transcriptional regulator with XRE-family HTH domain
MMNLQKTAQMQKINTTITPEMLKELRLALGQSLSEFGLSLKRSIDPKAEIGFSRQYISRLEHGDPKFVITDEIASAYWNIAGVLDDMPAGTGGAIIAQIMVQPGQIPDGVVPLLSRTVKIVRCKRPGCPVWFPKIGRQMYHDPECRQAHYRDIKKANASTPPRWPRSGR